MADPQSTQKTSAKRTASQTDASSVRSWTQRALNVFRPNFGKDTPGQRSTSRVTKLIMGTLIFVLVGQLLVTLETVLNVQFKLGLEQPVFKGMAWLNWFFLIYFVMLVGLWYGLNKFGFFPRPESLNAARNSRGSTSSSSGKKNPTQIPGIGGPRIRARRQSSSATPTRDSGSARKVATDASASSPSGDHDAAYERAKAAQRQRLRRARR